MPEADHRKQVRHYHEPGDFHELTFSCYRRMPLLANNRWRGYLSESIAEATAQEGFRLAGFVYMPEHVHLLVYPVTPKPRIDRLLAMIKRPCSVRIKEELLSRSSPLREKLTIRERPNRVVFRFWQEGPGYDRNLTTPKAVLASLDYLHLNPVRRGLCPRSELWRWSSARFYRHDGKPVDDPLLPPIAGLPPEWF